MSITHHVPACLGEAVPACVSPRPGVRQKPACDLGEARVWAALGGGWTCLHDRFCQQGVSVEWHDFECVQAWDWARSFHPHSVEVCLNVSGHARLTGGKDSALLGAMTLGIYAAGNEALAAWRLPGERHQFLTLEFSRDYLTRHLAGREAALREGVRRVVFPMEGEGRIAAVYPLAAGYRSVLAALRAPPVAGVARSLWYEGKALELMAALFFGADEEPIPVRSRQAEVGRERVERVIRVLARRLAEAPSLAELGREVGCSPYHLSRTFSREMGVTLPQYLRQIRMERAAELLKSGRFNVTEAALEVGYSSLSHFSHAFRETMGCCPGLYPSPSGPRAS